MEQGISSAKPLHCSRIAAILLWLRTAKRKFLGTCFGAEKVLGCPLRVNLQWGLKTQVIGKSRTDGIMVLDVEVGAGGSLVWRRGRQSQ